MPLLVFETLYILSLLVYKSYCKNLHAATGMPRKLKHRVPQKEISVTE